MTVKEVHFNHDPASHAADALTIKSMTSGLVIRAPEWRSGESAPAAYTAKTLRTPFTIKASFEDGPPNATRDVRAEAISNRPLIAGVTRVRRPSVDVGVQATPVSFDATGKSSLVDFIVLAAPGEDVVAAHNAAWSWQFLHDGAWHEFAVTRHRIYVIADAPTAPWCQGREEVNALQFPWTEALDVACAWAAGCDSPLAATDRLTRVIYFLSNQHYNTGSVLVDEFGDPFNLSHFLDDLGRASFTNECSGVTSALVTLANLLGDRLGSLEVWYAQGRFDTTPVRLIGEPDWTAAKWSRHEMATRQNHVINEHLLVYDSCLQFNSPPPLAVGMPLGVQGPAGDNYLFKLIASEPEVLSGLLPPRPLI